jgi:hypothetical protein
LLISLQVVRAALSIHCLCIEQLPRLLWREFGGGTKYRQ